MLPLLPLASYAAGEAVPLPAGYPTARDKLLILLAYRRMAHPILRVAKGSKGVAYLAIVLCNLE